jgi:Uma2 family endonuclease
MSVPGNVAHMSVDEYLSSEEHASVRREYVDGRVFAMTGVTKRHNIIAGNIYSILRAHVRGSQCRAYISDVKVRVEAANSFYYPDVMVSCEPFDHKSVFTSTPRLIVEVLSRSTAAIDRREKVLAYSK